jgi:hypothetical protein
MAPQRDGFLDPPPGSRIGVRPTLGAALAFLDAARAESMNAADLVHWLQASLVGPGLMPMPGTVQEPGAGTVALAPSPGPWAAAVETRLGRVVATARVRIGITLSGLLAKPADDRFLAAAIFAGRVARTSGARGSVWQAAPRASDRLSDVVLSLFAADVLSHREEYDACLCVCAVCNRVALRAGALVQTRCGEHGGVRDGD